TAPVSQTGLRAAAAGGDLVFHLSHLVQPDYRRSAARGTDVLLCAAAGTAGGLRRGGGMAAVIMLPLAQAHSGTCRGNRRHGGLCIVRGHLPAVLLPPATPGN